MKHLTHVASLLAVMLAVSATSAVACPGEKAKDEGKQSVPQQPATSPRT